MAKEDFLRDLVSEHFVRDIPIYLIEQNFGGLSFRRTNFSAGKIFGGQYFKHRVKFKALLSAEILSNKVLNFIVNRCS